MSSIDLERERQRLALDKLSLPRFAGRESSRPFVVALEGPNAAGKTTLGRSLSKTLGVRFVLGTDEAWFSEPFKARMIRDAEWHASAMFFLSGCFEQMRLLQVLPDPLIVMDRSIWSTLAVHAAESAERLEALIAMLRPVAGRIRIPDLTLVLEASFAICQSRMANKTGMARALDELTATSAFHVKEQEFYQWLGRRNPSLVFINVDHRTADEVTKKAVALIREKIPC